MSQFIVFNPMGPSGGGPILTLTGNTGGAVSPTGAGNINVIGDTTTINIVGTPGTNTLTASAAGSQVDTVQTTDDADTALALVTIANNEVAIIQSRVIGAYSSGVNRAFGCQLTVTVRKQGAAAVAIIQTEEQTALVRAVGVPATVDATYDTLGAFVRIVVTGEIGQTINWKSITTVLRQAAP